MSSLRLPVPWGFRNMTPETLSARIRWFDLLRAVGPAIIVASVVLGPGSILTSSQVGTAYGMQLLWIVGLAGLLMAGTVALSARLGVTLDHSLCDEVARRMGRPMAALVGISVFLTATCFQVSNNVAILAAVEPFVDAAPASAAPAVARSPAGSWIPALALLAVNAMVIVALFGMRKIYQAVERLMKVLVLIMAVAFLVNLAAARPSLLQALRGLLPSFPAEMARGWWPTLASSGLQDPLWAVQGLFFTTFSIAGAFYQSYLVREKGWTHRDLQKGRIDSILGIAVLAGLTGVVLMTSATVLHQKVDAAELNSVADVARQLRPVFGPWAMYLCSAGILAGAFSSFLVNSMIGGTLLADGFGWGSRMTDAGPKGLTTASLLIGGAIGIWVMCRGQRPVPLIVFTQAMTVLGLPLLALVLFLLSWRRADDGSRCPRSLQLVAATSLLVTFLLATRTTYAIYLTLTARS